MKLKNIFYTLGLAALLTGCSDSFDDWLNPQTNAQEEAKTVTVDVQTVAAIDFANVDGDQIKLFDISVALPDEATTSCVAYLYNADRTDSIAVEADAQGNASVADFRAAVEKLYGKRPVQRDVPVVVNAFVNTNGQSYRYVGETKVLVTLVAPVIESAYYLIGAHQGWNQATCTNYKFERADESVDVYDDPVFYITVDAPVNSETGAREDFWFNIVPESALSASNFWGALIGSDDANGDSRLEAGLAYKVDGKDNAFCQPASDGAKRYKITLNMMDYKMTVEPISYNEFIYVPGNPSWSPATAAALRSPEMDGVYTGFAYLDGEFKFTLARNWDAEYNYGTFTSYSDGFSEGGGGNIKMAEAGYYYLVVNHPAASLTATKTEWGIIGPAQAGGWDTDTDMTYDAEAGCWTCTLALAADEFKFRANDDWGINVGGTADDLEANGANLKIDEAGTYTVKLYLSRTNSDKMYCTIVKQ